MPLPRVWDPARDTAVHGTFGRDGVGLGDDDEGWLLEERDLDVELLGHALRGHVGVARPHDVLDVQARVRVPTSDLKESKRILFPNY